MIFGRRAYLVEYKRIKYLKNKRSNESITQIIVAIYDPKILSLFDVIYKIPEKLFAIITNNITMVLLESNDDEISPMIADGKIKVENFL